jgi:type IV pilus assembly protein PilA
MHLSVLHRNRGQAGFTLVELLVVMLIIGLLAAIAIPAFFNQRDKAQDARAKELAHIARTAIETYSTQPAGTATNTYAGANVARLRAIEPMVPLGCTGTAPNYTNAPCLVIASLGARSYRVTVWARTSRNSFAIARAATGAVTYPCTKPTAASPNGGCRITSGTSGTWN